MIEWIVSSSVLILMLIMIRWLFRKRLSMGMRYALWLVAALRLLVPVSFSESRLSVLNVVGQLALSDMQGDKSVYQESLYISQEMQGENIGAIYGMDQVSAVERDEIDRPQGSADSVDLEQQGSPQSGFTASVGGVRYKLGYSTGNREESQILIPGENAELLTGNGGKAIGGTGGSTGIWWLRFVWILGIFLSFGLVGIVNLRYWRCVYRSRKRYQGEKESRLPVYVSAAVRMPCMFGLIHPAIYLAQDAMEEKSLKYVLCHENTHYRHKDNLWTLVRLCCVCIHWFNPLVWLAAYLSRQDCELACDEETVARLGDENRIDYGRTLLSLSVQGGELFGGLRFSTTMSGRKKQLKERLQIIANQPKKKGGSLTMVLLFLPMLVLVTFTGSKKAEAFEEKGDVGKTEAGMQENGVGNREDEFYESGDVAPENRAYISVDLNDGGSYALQVISEPTAENGVYEINQINLCRVDGTGEILQSLCPGDVKPFYTEALQMGEYMEQSSGQQFLFRADGEPLYAKSLYGVEELSAYTRGRFLAEGRGSQLSRLPDGGIRVADLNFDGYEDFCVQIGVNSVNQSFYCYLWNPKEEQFEHSVMIPNVKVDSEARLLESATEDGGGQSSVKYYRFDEAGLLHMVRYVEENQSPDAVFPSLDLTYHETSYALPAVDNWDAETVYGGALNERFVYWAKEALTELYEWSGTKIDTACFAVTSFGDFCFGQTPQDLDASRCFYDRTFGARAGFLDVIEWMNLYTERVVWYSQVVQWNVPEQLKNMTDAQVVEWYFERSALTKGETLETLETIEQQRGGEYVIRAASGNYYEFFLNQASREVQSVYGPYGSYPLH